MGSNSYFLTISIYIHCDIHENMEVSLVSIFIHNRSCKLNIFQLIIIYFKNINIKTKNNIVSSTSSINISHKNIKSNCLTLSKYFSDNNRYYWLWFENYHKITFAHLIISYLN